MFTSRRDAFTILKRLRLRRLAESGCPWRVLQATTLSLWCRAHFGTWRSLFVAGARETSCFGAPKPTFRDRCKGSELLYTSKRSFRCRCSTLFVVIVDQLRFLTGAVNRDFWTCGSFADFVAGAVIGEPRSADFVAGAALGEPRSADFVAGAALGEPRSADFVAGTALCDPRCADFVAAGPGVTAPPAPISFPRVVPVPIPFPRVPTIISIISSSISTTSLRLLVLPSQPSGLGSGPRPLLPPCLVPVLTFCKVLPLQFPHPCRAVLVQWLVGPPLLFSIIHAKADVVHPFHKGL